jgi:hypothetical protein
MGARLEVAGCDAGLRRRFLVVAAPMPLSFPAVARSRLSISGASGRWLGADAWRPIEVFFIAHERFLQCSYTCASTSGVLDIGSAHSASGGYGSSLRESAPLREQKRSLRS